MRYWEILLLKHRENGQDGLTLPYLIGSQNLLKIQNERQVISSLINEMTLKLSFETCFRYCWNIQTFIFEIRKISNKAVFPTKNGCQQVGLSVGNISKDDFGETLEGLIVQLENRFQPQIDCELFSALPDVECREPKWTRFTKDDQKFIEECFSSTIFRNNANSTGSGIG